MVKYKLYKDCHELQLDHFIRCECDNDLTALVKSGEVPKCVLEEHWRRIYIEYCDLTGEVDYKAMVRCMVEMLVLNARIEKLNILIELLSKGYSEYFTKNISSLGLMISIDPDKPDSYNKALTSCIRQAKTWKIQLKELEVELIRLQNKSSEDAGLNREYYTKVLVNLSKFMSFHIRATEITVAEYALMIYQYRTESEITTSKKVA